jgi:hypothetical protein
MDAEGIGSSVELTVKEAQEKPTINVFLNGGRTNILNGRYNAASGGTFGERLLKSKKLGVLGNVAFDFNGRGIDNYQPQIDPLSTMAQPFYDNTATAMVTPAARTTSSMTSPASSSAAFTASSRTGATSGITSRYRPR